MVFWTDATFGSMLGFYESFDNLAPPSLRRGWEVERAALERAALAVYSSDWAAASAVRDHGADPARVRVLSLGANLEFIPTPTESRALIERRIRPGPCRLLLVGVDWKRKGVAIAVGAFEELRRLGVASQLQIAGCRPPAGTVLPEGVEIVGFVDKNTRAGQERLGMLYREADFFILPSRAEAYGVAYCEAAAFGLPCLATAVGGVPSIIRRGENDELFSLDAGPADYTRWIAEVWQQPARYRALANGSLDAYHERLNPDRSVAALVEEMSGLVTRPSVCPADAVLA